MITQQSRPVVFEGQCPECQMRGIQAAMQLNQEGYLECPVSGLQIALTPPYATLLWWRGQGNFAADGFQNPLLENALPLVEALKTGSEVPEPDPAGLVADEQELDWFLHEVYNDHETFKAHYFDKSDPAFDHQRQRLAWISQERWEEIFQAFHSFCDTGITIDIQGAKGFRHCRRLLEEAGVIFHFDWQKWRQGWINIRNPKYPWHKASLLELSMYLSAIFLSEPYDPGTVEFYFNDKTLERLLKAIKAKVLLSNTPTTA